MSTSRSTTSGMTLVLTPRRTCSARRWCGWPTTRTLASPGASWAIVRRRARDRRGPFTARLTLERADEGAPEIVHVGRRPVVREATDHLRGLDQRVVRAYGIDPCPGVPWTRSRRQATPFSPTCTVTFSSSPCAVTVPRSRSRGSRPPASPSAACRRDRRPARRRPPRRRRPSRPGCRAAATRPAPGQRLEGHGLRGGEVQHVERAAAPTPRRSPTRPRTDRASRLGGHRHHVGVAHQAQRRCGRVGPLDAGDQAGVARRPVGLVDLEIEAAAFADRRAARRWCAPPGRRRRYRRSRTGCG